MRVLVVDDVAMNRDIANAFLRAAGHAVVCAEGGAEAVALAAAADYDAVLMDVRMPEMDGLALLREAQRRRPGLRCILLTGYATNDAELAVSGAVAGTFSLLRKPVTMAALAERIAMLLACAEAAR